MSKLSRNQITAFKQGQRRQAIYEKRYAKQFYNYLRKCYYDSAREIEIRGVNARIEFDNAKLENIFRKLFKRVTIQEAKITYQEHSAMFDSVNRVGKKDIIDDLANLFSGTNTNLIRVWRSLLDEFIEVRLTGRIQRINHTTQERIRKIIEDGLFEGLGQEDVARLIRQEAKSNINTHRSRAIARTETVVASNQGRYMSAMSSDLKMKKKWIPVQDARTRDGFNERNNSREANHLIMLQKDWIPLEDDFLVPNKNGIQEPAKYPGDERLSAGNVINCRCAVVFEAMRDSDGDLILKR
jgi:hypothetical protein